MELNWKVLSRLRPIHIWVMLSALLMLAQGGEDTFASMTELRNLLASEDNIIHGVEQYLLHEQIR